jgi:hypothetical protein
LVGCDARRLPLHLSLRRGLLLLLALLLLNLLHQSIVVLAARLDTLRIARKTTAHGAHDSTTAATYH